jgi:hypothetical protein
MPIGICNHCGHEEEKQYIIINSAGIEHLRADCAKCGRYKRFVPQDKPLSEWVMPFGKYKGKKLKEIDYDYLWWGAENITGNSGKKITAYLESLSTDYTKNKEKISSN